MKKKLKMYTDCYGFYRRDVCWKRAWELCKAYQWYLTRYYVYNDKSLEIFEGIDLLETCFYQSLFG